MNMCDRCFTNEIKSFVTQADFEEIDLVLTKKITNDKNLKMGKFVVSGLDVMGYQIYECLVCGQAWKLSAPDNSYRGYFLRLIK